MEQVTPETSNTSATGSNGDSGTSSGHKNTTMAAVAYILFFVPLLTDAKDDPFVRYHVRQGLALFVAWALVSIVAWIPPILFVSPLLHLGMFALMVVGIIRASGGKEEPLPIIGAFAENIKL